MSIRKISRKKAYTIAALVFIAVIVVFLWRDLNLANRAGDIPLPDIIVENIEIEREINGAQWKLISPRVEHRDGLFYGESLDITITESGDKVTRINADKGVFTRANNDIEMTSADAVMTEKNNVYNLKAGRVEFEAAKELWRFFKDVIITDGKITVEGKEGTYDTKSGECIVSGGGVVTWKE
ncbi:MAG: LPS export ABC transporter periplasmic protein LptC [Synergistaceae bacterium]|nr:LPS export ABC transporter periplasmic protein LptC [Synergistaceae bacterium]